MMLEQVRAVMLRRPPCSGTDMQMHLEQYLIYMGWHRREPGQPYNHVFVSLATCVRPATVTEESS